MSARRSSASSGSSAAASSSAAAASAASAALPPARGRSTHSSGAASSACGKGSAKQAAPPSTAPSLSSHKRPAAASAGASSAAAAAASAAVLSDQSAVNASQLKKQRGEYSSKQSNGSSAAAAASSAGLDPLPTPPRRPAASSAAASDASSTAVAQLSSNRNIAKPSAGSGKPALAAAAAASLAPPASIPHRLFSEAKELLSGGLPFAESKALRSNELTKRALAAARQSIALPASAETMMHLGCLCEVLLCWFDTLYPPNQLPEQTALRGWILRTDALFTQLVTELPRLKLSWENCCSLIGSAVFVGALQAVPALVRCVGGFPSHTMGTQPLLTYYCIKPQEHVVSLQPYLRLFEYGLDPTEVKAGGDPLSALQLARNFIRTHPVPARPVALPAEQPFLRLAFAILGVMDDEDGWREAQTLRDGAVATMEAAVAKAEPQAIPSVLFARVIQQRESAQPIEMQRRAVLQAQFMHALIPAWLTHSTKVRALLLDAAPGRLIPPLVDVVSRYLDLEGVPPERSAPVEEKAEMV